MRNFRSIPVLMLASCALLFASCEKEPSSGASSAKPWRKIKMIKEYTEGRKDTSVYQYTYDKDGKSFTKYGVHKYEFRPTEMDTFSRIVSNDVIKLVWAHDYTITYKLNKDGYAVEEYDDAINPSNLRVKYEYDSESYLAKMYHRPNESGSSTWTYLYADKNCIEELDKSGLPTTKTSFTSYLNDQGYAFVQYEYIFGKQNKNLRDTVKEYIGSLEGPVSVFKYDFNTSGELSRVVKIANHESLITEIYR